MNKIFFNNEFISSNAFHMDPNDRGFLLGDGLFETMRAIDGRINFLADHWERLIQGTQVLHLSLPFDLPQFEKIILQILQVNNLQNDSAALRLTITRGSDVRGLLLSQNTNPTVILTAQPFANQKNAYAAIVVDIRRNEFSPLANIKSLNYLDQILARQQAAERNAEEALMLNTQGNLACASSANVFLVKNNKLYTPALKDGALPGITRKQVLRIVRNMEIEAVEQTLSLDELFAADEVFLTNSLIGIMPVIKINDSDIKKIGEMTLKLQSLLNVR